MLGKKENVKVIKGADETNIKLLKDVSSFYDTFMLYNAAISTTNPTPRQYVSSISKTEEITGPIARLFSKLNLLVSKWGYKIVDACNNVTDMIGDKRLKSFLVRLSQAARLSDNLGEFLRLEYEKYVLTVNHEHDATINRLKVFTDAYTAILTSIAFVFITMLITSVVFGLADPLLISLIMGITVGTSLISVLILVARTVPKDTIPHKMQLRPRDLASLERITRIMILSGIPFIALPIILTPLGFSPKGILSYLFPASGPMMVFGAFSHLIGVKGRKIIGLVKNLELSFPIMIKTLGDAAGIGGNITNAIRTIRHNEYGPLNKLINKLYSRLRIGLQSDLCWKYFEAESGSDMIRKHTSVFYLAVNEGASPIDCANKVFDSASSVLDRRKKRSQVAGYAKGIIIPLQATLVAIVSLMSILMEIFYTFGSLVAAYVGFLAPIDPVFMKITASSIVLIMTFGNSFLLYLLEDESIFNLAYSLGAIMALSGLIISLVSAGAETMLKAFTRLEEVVSQG